MASPAQTTPDPWVLLLTPSVHPQPSPCGARGIPRLRRGSCAPAGDPKLRGRMSASPAKGAGGMGRGMKHWGSGWLCAGAQGAGHQGCPRLGSGSLPTPPGPPACRQGALELHIGRTHPSGWWDQPRHFLKWCGDSGQGKVDSPAGAPKGAHKSHRLDQDPADTGHSLHLAWAPFWVWVRPSCKDRAALKPCLQILAPCPCLWAAPAAPAGPGLHSAGGRDSRRAGCFCCGAVWHPKANMSYQQEGNICRFPCLPFGFGSCPCSCLHNGTGGRQGWAPGGHRTACP